MGVATSLIVVGAAAAVAAGASAASADAKRHAAHKAGDAQKSALTGQAKILEDELSYSRVNQQAVEADRQRAKDRIALQEQVDPELAQLRKLGKQQLLDQARQPNASQQSVQVAKQLFTEFQKPDAKLEAIKNQIIDKAQEDLKAGATLPPEYQAELVRGGLVAAGQSGLKPAVSTIGGKVAQELGAAGINLAAQRTNEAQRLTSTANDIQTSRAKILESIFPTISQSEATQRQVAAATFGLGEATLPQAGLTGQEAAQLQINRGNTLMNLRGKRGAVSAQNALASGEAQAQQIGAIGQFANTIGGAAGNYFASGGGSISAPKQYGDVGYPGYVSPASERRAAALLS